MNEERIKGLKNNEIDNVATIFGQVVVSSEVDVMDSKGNTIVVKVLDEVPYGHKIALKEIKIGEQITKYGEEIGVATKEIKVGEHVHIHNIDSIRGRGDWAKEGGKN
ncbi:UxaA family hydrolase [Crassaminicella profunda]|uniref:UxaA family hydrolase n=1 Tax=Crassaminicella profunda TaxID=1286698 RepID=UPI001CA638C5|nr:UxaA family hydrolase [Crassaminicella profunda]QZY56200.1 UxaA family hydrolase [Crassaminicella profunda]